MPNYNGVWSLSTQYQYADQWNLDNLGPPRGLFAGGSTALNGSSVVNVITFITISTTGNSVDFGDLTAARKSLGGFSSSTRACFAGGFINDDGDPVNTVDFVTIANAGNATDFGDMSAAAFETKGLSNLTRGVISLGFTSGKTDTMEYFTIASVGNATDFGNLAAATVNAVGVSSSTRGVFAGGNEA